MIPVIDERSGQAVAIGETVPAAEGAWWKLAEVRDWWVRARVTVHTDRGVRRRWLAVTIRMTLFGPQRVAIYPS